MEGTFFVHSVSLHCVLLLIYKFSEYDVLTLLSRFLNVVLSQVKSNFKNPSFMKFSVLWTLFGLEQQTTVQQTEPSSFMASVCSICRSVHVHRVCAYGPVGLQRHRHECRAYNPINQRRQIKLPRAAKRCISITAVIIT